MAKYCNQCGAKLDDDTLFCSECGAKQETENASSNEPSKNKLMIGGLIAVIIILIIILIFFSGAFDFKGTPEIVIHSGSTMTSEDELSLSLTNINGNLKGREIKITFSNDENNYEFKEKTDEEGNVKLIPNVKTGTYNVVCEYEGDSSYHGVTETRKITVEEPEPDYESYSYPHSFASTDTNGDGYVLLNDMNIAHTPKDIQYQMYADSDDNGDGKLNEHEYYKFMYKLNYDFHSYGL